MISLSFLKRTSFSRSKCMIWPFLLFVVLSQISPDPDSDFVGTEELNCRGINFLDKSLRGNTSSVFDCCSIARRDGPVSTTALQRLSGALGPHSIEDGDAWFDAGSAVLQVGSRSTDFHRNNQLCLDNPCSSVTYLFTSVRHMLALCLLTVFP